MTHRLWEPARPALESHTTDCSASRGRLRALSLAWPIISNFRSSRPEKRLAQWFAPAISRHDSSAPWLVSATLPPSNRWNVINCDLCLSFSLSLPQPLLSWLCVSIETHKMCAYLFVGLIIIAPDDLKSFSVTSIVLEGSAEDRSEEIYIVWPER